MTSIKLTLNHKFFSSTLHIIAAVNMQDLTSFPGLHPGQSRESGLPSMDKRGRPQSDPVPSCRLGHFLLRSLCLLVGQKQVRIAKSHSITVVPKHELRSRDKSVD